MIMIMIMIIYDDDDDYYYSGSFADGDHLRRCTFHHELGPFQTPLHSCAEPNSIRFDFGVTLKRRLIQTAYLRRS